MGLEEEEEEEEEEKEEKREGGGGGANGGSEKEKWGKRKNCARVMIIAKRLYGKGQVHQRSKETDESSVTM